MNIVTYATKCSIQPEELWAVTTGDGARQRQTSLTSNAQVSVFKGTKTHEYFFSSNIAVLQLLAKQHAPLLAPLGQSSGRDQDKRQMSEDAGFAWDRAERVIGMETEDLQSWPELLDDCLGYVELRLRSTLDAGDHDLCLCEVVRSFRAEGQHGGEQLEMSIGRQFLQ
eukprot:scaffold300_cov258-Pinguiococcus_pyrenoidosus.AAC.29